MSNKKEKIVVVLSESPTASIIKDAGRFAVFAGLLYFNHEFLSGSAWIDTLFILIVLITVGSKASSRTFEGPTDQAIKYLKEKK